MQHLLDSSPHSHEPQSLLDLFLTFNWMALQGFGGVLTVAQRVLCEQKRWLTTEQFAEDWAVSQVLPGPNVVNLAIMLGDRYFGIRGALVGILGLFLAPLAIALMLATLYDHFATAAMVVGAVKGMSAVAAGLIAAVGLKLFASIRTSPVGKTVFTLAAIVSFVVVGVYGVALIWAIVWVGIPTVLWTYWRLRRSTQAADTRA